MNFLRNFFASLLALFVFCIAIVIFFSIMVSAIASKEKVEVSSNSILHLKLDKPIEEYEFEDPLAELPLNLATNAMGLVQIKQALHNAKNDENIKGVFLEIPMIFTSGFTSLEEIRKDLIDFRSSGKFVISYSEYYSEAAYYLSTAADYICIHPEGDFEFNGLSAEIAFFKGLFEKLDIQPQVFRVGDFKSAVEPFIRTEMSEENELQIKSLLESVYNNMLDSISKSREIPVEKLRNISDQMLVRNASEAIESGLIDHAYYYDQVDDLIRERLELEKDAAINYIKYEKYKKSYSTYKSSKNEIAVIVANGDIMPGEGDNYTIGSNKFAQEIKNARLNEQAKAIVIRINSPGGSFVASDVMWREIELASEVKPVIASMSNVAASGGYYMAMACDTIVAMPNTITGSIGIFGIIMDASGFFNNKLGITFDEVKTGELSNLYTMTRSLSEREKSIIQKDVEAGYETFVRKAAEDRGMTVEQIKKVASGRVWSGEQAFEHNLVDVLGDFNVAITIAAEKAGVTEDYKVRYYPKPKTVLEELFKGMETKVKAHYLSEEFGSSYTHYKKAQQITKQQGIMSRMDYDLIIQ